MSLGLCTYIREYPVAKAANAVIIDMHGRKVIAQPVMPGNSNEVDISSLPAGIYLVKIGELTKKFIKLSFKL